MTVPFDTAIGAIGEECKSSSALHRYNSEAELKGLVVSSDDEVRRKLAEMLRRGGIAPVSASTVAESGMRLSVFKIQIVICQDRLVDGRYEAIVKIVNQSKGGAPAPVIVFSRTGDWPDYLTALRAGAFDYLVYPPIPGEFERIMQNALRDWREQHHFKENGRGKEPCTSTE